MCCLLCGCAVRRARGSVYRQTDRPTVCLCERGHTRSSQDSLHGLPSSIVGMCGADMHMANNHILTKLVTSRERSVRVRSATRARVCESYSCISSRFSSESREAVATRKKAGPHHAPVSTNSSSTSSDVTNEIEKTSTTKEKQQSRSILNESIFKQHGGNDLHRCFWVR